MFNFSDIKAIIFDLDDTLVKSTLDFARLKKDIGCDKSDDILTFIAEIACLELREKAHQTVLMHELQEAQTSTWLPGAREFVHQALSANLPLAIVTRNCREATSLKIQNNNIPIEIVLTREDAPAKPDPTALLIIARQWQLPPSEIAYIGDYKYDILAAHNANMQAWLYKPDDNKNINAYARHLFFVPAS